MSTMSSRRFYLDYPYKKLPENPNTIPNPYFNKTESTDCKESLRIDEWVLVMRKYFDIVEDYLLQGHRFELPGKLGYLEITRSKRKNKFLFINKVAVEAGYDQRLYGEINNWRPFVKWRPKDKSTFQAQVLKCWKIKIGEVFKKNIHRHLIKNQNNLLNYSQS